ncbi:Aste57867_25351 [Aphanomyces stellatus]|uniref:Aste57867_25351 protein n=1 Tax=Aphanomyces stellatus TaxID=120398 RepID=A0A485LXM2_9STRA|nr:hypothetical protein As57867_025273 [Aphanomyces stellatus]VFU01976.1 Aste57867_25351 [Aphanomyces stellatus]
MYQQRLDVPHLIPHFEPLFQDHGGVGGMRRIHPKHDSAVIIDGPRVANRHGLERGTHGVQSKQPGFGLLPRHFARTCPDRIDISGVDGLEAHVVPSEALGDVLVQSRHAVDRGTSGWNQKRWVSSWSESVLCE